MMDKTNRVVCYPVPKGAVLQQDYCVRVRAVGDKVWHELKTFRVKVDMHDIREASMVYFDFKGQVEVEVTFPRFYTIYHVAIRPLALNIKPRFEAKRITFLLDKPCDISVEINKDRFHNLHVFTNAIEPKPDKRKDDVLVVKGSLEYPGFIGDSLNDDILKLPLGRTVYIEAGIHYIGECLWHIPSHTKIYLEGGAILVGSLVCESVESIQILGRGVMYLANFERFTSLNGIKLSFAKSIFIENMIIINPPHYSFYMGGASDIHLKSIRAFSCEGWSDGIDMMNVQDVTINGGFLRTSDDSIAIYGSRWGYYGDSKNIRIKNLSLWADGAHPTMIGTHGDYKHNGNKIEDIVFENIDVLEHHEFQAGYLGVMAINVGDKNVVQNITYRNIRIEPFEHGKLLDIQVKWNPVYNLAPGKGVNNIYFEDIFYNTGTGEEDSTICGYNANFKVKEVTFKRLYRDGKLVKSFEEAHIVIGKFTEDIKLL